MNDHCDCGHGNQRSDLGTFFFGAAMGALAVVIIHRETRERVKDSLIGLMGVGRMKAEEAKKIAQEKIGEAAYKVQEKVGQDGCKQG